MSAELSQKRVSGPLSAADIDVAAERIADVALRTPLEFCDRLSVATGAQVYLKRGSVVPMHAHESEQMTYILQGALKFFVGGEEITVREGEVLHIPSWVEHQAEAIEDTFELDLFSPIRSDWLNPPPDDLQQ